MMNSIPVLTVSGNNLPEAWERSLLELYSRGCDVVTEYDNLSDIRSRDATMTIVIDTIVSEPRIHRCLPCGLDGLYEYELEFIDGIKDHCIRNKNDPDDKRWEYTYHDRLFNYNGVDQIESMVKKLVAGHTRRAIAITWMPEQDNECYDPPCLQSIWCRIVDNTLNMNVHFRSNDAYKAAFMNMYVLGRLQEYIAKEVSNKIGWEIKVGRYVHTADSYHIYGRDMDDFNAKFLKMLRHRSFEQRTYRREDVLEIMLENDKAIREKAESMRR